MNGRVASSEGGATARRRWPERVNRAVVVLAIVLLLVGTPLISANLFSEEVEEQIVSVEPQSYRAFHFAIYGYGKLSYEYEGVSEAEISFLVLDRFGFDRFQDGEGYDAPNGITVGLGSGGGGAMSGVSWELYFVLLNEGTEQAALRFGAEADARFSYPVAAAMLGIAAAVGYSAERMAGWRSGMARGRTGPRRGWTGRRAAVTTGAAATALLTVVFFVVNLMAYRLSGDSMVFGFLTGAIGVWLGALASTAVVFSLRFRIAVVPGKAEAVLDDLAHRMRVSGYRVTMLRDELSVMISSTAAIVIYVRPVPGGARVSYRVSAAAPGYLALIILIFASMASSTAPLVLALVIFMLYRTAAFADDRVLPRLSAPREGPRDAEAPDTRMVLVAGLSEAKRLSAEVLETAKAKRNSWVLIFWVAFVIAYAQTFRFMSVDMAYDDSIAVRLMVGLVAGVAAALVYWVMVSRRLRTTIGEMRAWTERLDGALWREVEGGPPDDAGPSSFELIAESYGEAPKWLAVRRRGGMFREPLYWLLMIGLGYVALSTGVSAVFMSELGIGYSLSLACLSAMFLSLSVLMYRRWHRRQREEDEAMLREMAGRLQTIREGMERHLGSV